MDGFGFQDIKKYILAQNAIAPNGTWRKMQRTNVVELVANKGQKKLLLEMMTLSSCVWNMANYNFRQAIINKEKVNSFFRQQQAIQNSDNYQRLGRSYALPMLQKHSFLVNGFFGLIKSKTQEEVGLPKYYNEPCSCNELVVVREKELPIQKLTTDRVVSMAYDESIKLLGEKAGEK